MKRRGSQSALANPVLVGAVTVLVILVALFLSYDANSGLPFVPTRELRVVVGDGSDLVLGNDVREGGFRVGLVSDLRPVRLASGVVGALLTLKLDQAHGRVPVDSTVSVLPRNLLGLKYVQLNRGVSSRVFADGATLPVSRTSVPVQFDDVFKTFDARTRAAIQRSLRGSGDVLAGRGSALNDTIASLPVLLGHLRPVAHYLASPSGGLTRFLNDVNLFMAAVAPVAGVQVRLFSEAATTFRAISSDPNALAQTIALSPGALSTGTTSLRVQMPLLVDLTTFGNALTPASAELRGGLPTINPAIESGTRVLGRTPTLNRGLQGVMGALKNLARAPGTNIAINGLSDTTGTLNPMVRYLGPYQTVCDYWNYWWTYLSEHISQPTSYGYSQRALLNLATPGTNSVQQVGATAPVSGESGSDTALGIFGGQQNLHSQNYGAAVDNQGNADCEVGQRGYPQKLTADPQGRKIVTDVHTPGDQGPTYAGLSRVPPGETFSRAPTTGPSAG
jgi:ABC-type transporter Mla subunit MlaD